MLQMARNRGRSLLAAALICALALLILPAPAARAEADGMARVKLTRLGSNSSITIQPTCDYYVEGNPSIRIAKGTKATIAASGAEIRLTVNGASLSMGDSLLLRRSQAGKAGIKFTSPSMSNLFCGDLYLTASSSILTPILNIYIEDYLYGVVGYEMSASWPLEALKAQAVAARNYALQKMNERKNKLYHLVDNTSNQVFKGLNTSSSYAPVIQAVDGTRGIALYYGSSLASCYYTASNGGQTESTKNAWGSSLAYSTVKDDPYDLASSGTTRSADIRRDAQGLNEALRAALADGVAQKLSAAGQQVAGDGVTINRIENITAKDPRFAAPSRLYRTLTFTVSATAVNVNGQTASGTLDVNIPTYGGLEAWYGLSINSGNNETITVTGSDSAFRVSFRRYGHGIGMSQRGAQVMAKDHGMSAAQILEFYYPGTKAKQLNLTDTTSDKAAPSDPTPIATAKAAAGACLYASASSSAEKTVSLAEGTALTIYAVSGSWAAAGADGKLGFIPTAQLSNYLPIGAQVVVANKELYAMVTAEGGTALRELPAEGSTQRVLLAKDSYVRVYACAGQWASVATPSGQTGYAPIAALRLQDLPAATATPVPTVVTPDGEMYARVNAGGATLRYWPDAEAQVVEQLSANSYVMVQAYSGEWARVLSISGKTGYALCSQLTVTALPTATPAPTASTGVIVPEEAMYAQARETAEIYEQPSTAAPSVGRLSAGAYARVLAYTREWVRIETISGIQGFAPIGKLRVVDAEQAFSPSSPAPTPTATPAPTSSVTVPEAPMYAKVKSDTPVYAQAAASSSVILRLSKGSYVRVLAYTHDWANIQTTSGAKGFAPIGTLTVVSPQEALATPTPAPSNGVIVPDGDMFARATVSTSVYKSLSTSSKSLAKLSKNTRVRVLAYTREWVRVRTDAGVEGFVPIGRLVVVANAEPKPTAAPSSPIQQRYICSATAGLYASNSTKSKLLRTLPYGTAVELGASQDGWACVRHSGKVGFVKLSNLTSRSPFAKSASDVIVAEFNVRTTCSAKVYTAPSKDAKVMGTLAKNVKLRVYAYNNAFAYVGAGSNRGFVALSDLKIVVG